MVNSLKRGTYLVCYDFDGNDISVEAWNYLMSLSEVTDCRILANGEIGKFWISTVWLGVNLNYGEGPPLIFETMIFGRDEEGIDYDDLYMQRYSTKEDAIKWHSVLVEKLKEGTPSDKLPHMESSS